MKIKVLPTNYYAPSEHIMVLEFNLSKFRWELWCSNIYCVHGTDSVFPVYFKWWQVRSAYIAYKYW